MFALFLLSLLAVWLAWDGWREWWARKQESERRTRKAEMRRQCLMRNPESASSYEALGDAMREAGEIREAIACYEEAMQRRGSAHAGISGGGLENKIRLARFEQKVSAHPDEHGQTMRTRQQVCRTCGALCGSQDETCTACGTPLPVDGFFDTLRRAGLRQGIVREMLEIFAKVALVLIALSFCSWMPLEMKGAVLIASVIVIPFRLLKRLGDG